MKKTIAFCLIIVLCASLTGCSGCSFSSDKGTTSESTPTVTVTAEPTEEPTVEPTKTETPEPTETDTPEPTETETPKPTETETPEPTIEYTPEPTETETPTPTPTETETPTPTPTEAPQENMVYYGSLAQEGGSGQIGLVELDGDQLTISGSIYVQPEDEYQGYFDGTPQDNATFTFTVSDSAKFFFSGGDAADQEASLDEFVQSAQNYNGLGLILCVENGLLVKGEISS